MTQEVYTLLTKPKKIRADIRKTESEIDGLRLSMLPTGITYDKDIVQTSPDDPMAQYVVRVEALLNRLKTLKLAYLEAQDKVVEACNKLSSPQSEIISLRFISGWSFEKIAESFPMSERQMFRYYKKGLMEIDEQIKRCQ